MRICLFSALSLIPFALLAWNAPRAFAQTGCESNIVITQLEVLLGHNGYYGEALYVEKDLTFNLSVTSNCQIESLTALALGRSATFTQFEQTRWRGIISLVGQPRGPFTLTATATDVNGAQAQRSVELFHDTSPVITISAPTPASVARPTVHVVATCADDDPAGCSSMAVSVEGSTQLTGVARVEGDVSLAAYEGRQMAVVVSALDSIGRRTQVHRDVLVASNPRWVEVAHSPHGPVLADSANYLISFAQESPGPGIPILREKSTGVEHALSESPVSVAFMETTPHGAIWSQRTGNITTVREWRNGMFIELGPLGAGGGKSIDATSRHAAWLTPGASSTIFGLTLRNLETGVTVPVATSGIGHSISLAQDGSVVYRTTDGRGLARYRDGVTTLLPTVGSLVFEPRADEINVAYVTDRFPGNNVYIRLVTPTSDTVLTNVPVQGNDFVSGARPDRDYAVNGGWTAFVKRTGATRHVWLQSPDGVQQQITFFNDNTAAIEALSDDGRLLVSRARSLYLKVPGLPLQQIGTMVEGHTRAFWREGHLYFRLGSSVFRFGKGPFTDDPLVRNVTPVRALHILELRNRIDAARDGVGLGSYVYTDPNLGAGHLIRRDHVSELRAALDEVYTAKGLTRPAYTDAALLVGMPLKAVHIQELRVATVFVE
jgi:hypothetical protein